MTFLRTFFVLIFFSQFFINCHPSKANLNAGITIFNITDYGAISNDELDDSKAFDEIFKRISQRPGNYIIIIPRGNFDIDKQINADNLEGKISFKGNEGAVINVRGYGFGVFKARAIPVEIVKVANRNSSLVQINTKSIKEIETDDLVHIESNSLFETAWKYKEHDIHRVKRKIGNILELHSKFLFNYYPSLENVKGTVYKNCQLSFSNLVFKLSSEIEKKGDVPRRTMIIVWGTSFDMAEVQFIYNGEVTYYHVGLSILASEKLRFSNIKLHGFMYGLLMNFCRNIEGKNTLAEFCRHAYTPTQATVDVKVENLRGENCHSVMDAHQAFNVHYKNVTDTLATQFPNCRSLGTFIENANIYIAKNAYQDYAYWSVQSLTKEYESIYKEYDTRFSGVNYIVPKASAFNGLTSFTCRNLIVEDCTVSSIAYYGDQKALQKVSIKDSRVGVIRIDAQKTEVEHTVMDGYLFPNASYVFRFTGGGLTRLNNVTVKNYDPSRTYLFDMFYNQPAMNQMIISNSTIGKLKGFSNKLVYPGKKYESINVRSSMIEEFTDKVNDEFPKVREHIKSQKKIQR